MRGKEDNHAYRAGGVLATMGIHKNQKGLEKI